MAIGILSLASNQYMQGQTGTHTHWSSTTLLTDVSSFQSSLTVVTSVSSASSSRYLLRSCGSGQPLITSRRTREAKCL